MTQKQVQSLARYIAAYIEYEFTEYGRMYEPQMIEEAIESYQGGAR